MKRVNLHWRVTAPGRPLEALLWAISANDMSAARLAKLEAEEEEVVYVGEGEGIGTSFSSIPEALAYAEYEGDVVINREEALVEHARRRNWSRRG
jgi:hypothetical protein